MDTFAPPLRLKCVEIEWAMANSAPRPMARGNGSGALWHWALVALAPAAVLVPTQGRMLVIPIIPASTETSLGWASKAGARMIGPGSGSGSVLIEAKLAEVWLPALTHGAVLIPAQLGGCGASTEDLK